MTHPTIFDHLKALKLGQITQPVELLATKDMLGCLCNDGSISDAYCERYAQRMLLEHDVAPKGEYVLQVDGHWALGRTVRVVTPQTDMAAP